MDGACGGAEVHPVELRLRCWLPLTATQNEDIPYTSKRLRNATPARGRSFWLNKRKTGNRVRCAMWYGELWAGEWRTGVCGEGIAGAGSCPACLDLEPDTRKYSAWFRHRPGTYTHCIGAVPPDALGRPIRQN